MGADRYSGNKRRRHQLIGRAVDGIQETLVTRTDGENSVLEVRGLSLSSAPTQTWGLG